MVAHPFSSRGGISGGFTIVELCVTVLIIAILGAIGVPRYAASLCRYRVDSAARLIAADVARTQSLARITSATQTITFNFAASSYTIAMTDPDRPNRNYSVDLTQAPYDVKFVTGSLTKGTVNAAGLATISFTGLGVPSTGGTLVISCGSATRTLTLDPDTGQVTYQ
jgi:Tfp pilus assembly protein FimT